jgi:HSP20 family molecular chaperone IbpA
MDIPGVKVDDIMAQVENDGKVLHISGVRRKIKKTNEDGTAITTSETKFEKRFVLDHEKKNIHAEKITANLQDGVLTIIVPKELEQRKTSRKIAINNGHPAPELEHEDDLNARRKKIKTTKN